jgi:hypothetical protein
MTPDDRLTAGLEAYFDSGPRELSDRVIESVRAQLPTTKQQRRGLGLRLPWRVRMSSSTKLLAVAGGALVLVVAAGGGLFNSFLPKPGTGTEPTLAPASSSPGASPSEPSTASPTFMAPNVAFLTPTAIEPKWTAGGTPDTTFWTPVLAPDGRIWVPASELDVIRIYDQDGTLADTWGTPGTSDAEFRFGNSDDRDRGGIVFAPDGTFFVLDSSNSRVQHFSADRQFLSSFGSYGMGDGQFVWPLAIGLDDAANLYVSDDGRNDVQVFTTDGTYVRTIAVNAAGGSLWGSGPGWFMTTRLTDDRPGATEYHADGTVQGGWNFSAYACEPMGVTRDAAPRNIYVTCGSTSGGAEYLLRFDQGGTLLATWSIGEANGIAVTPDGSAAFVVSGDMSHLVRYDIDPPIGG